MKYPVDINRYASSSDPNVKYNQEDGTVTFKGVRLFTTDGHIPDNVLLNPLIAEADITTSSTKITSIVPGSNSAGTVKVGTKKVGRLSLSYTVDKLDFKIDTNPNANKVYGIKTQNIRAVIDNDEIKVTSFSGEPVKVDIPNGSIENSVAEKISLTNLPPEDLITIVMGGGARKISAVYDQFTESENLNNEFDPELTIKVDAKNKNKVEIFDKISGHSIASRILDVNRVFEINNTKFQFSDDTIVNNSFDFSSNKDGFGDNRNIINILNLQGSDLSLIHI